MKLSEALKGIDIVARNCDMDIEVVSVSNNSRKVSRDGIFAAMMGADSGVHGIKYAPSAVDAGAVCVVTDADCDESLPYVRVENAEHAYALIAENLAGHPARKLKLIGVTGTKGKTTVTHLVRTILEENGLRCGLIGTNEILIGSERRESSATTPEPPELNGCFSDMVKAGCEYCVMEVSSHALALGRVDGLEFEAAAFTNLTLDHLNYHKDMDSYAAAKSKLFGMAKNSVINIDADYAELMKKSAAGGVLTYSARKNEADLVAKNIRLNPGSVEFEALSTARIRRMKLGIPGMFSVYNALAAIGLCSVLGLGFEEIAKGLEKAQGVCGRAEVLRIDKDYTVMIDYAHTPDSLENILKTVRAFTPGRIITLFGCGGDRDKSKRPLMGKIAETLSDVCVVTSDNPRTEDPEAIINDILAGMTGKNHTVIVNRKEAIGHALDIARPGDLVLLAGKGHETYQDIGGVKHHFDEREIVCEHLF